MCTDCCRHFFLLCNIGAARGLSALISIAATVWSVVNAVRDGLNPFVLSLCFCFTFSHRIYYKLRIYHLPYSIYSDIASYTKIDNIDSCRPLPYTQSHLLSSSCRS